MNDFFGLYSGWDNSLADEAANNLASLKQYHTVICHRFQKTVLFSLTQSGTPEASHNEKGSFGIAASARIDNREDLITSLHLEGAGSLTSDSVIILAAYKKWKEHSPENLIGDYAFALWDEKAKKLFCARDRLGIKPFYYYHSKDIFCFSSRISLIFQALDITKEPHLDSMAEFLYLGHIASHERSFFKNIRRLPPGSHLTYNNGAVKVKNYWNLDNITANGFSLMENADRFRKLFSQAVQCRLGSSHPTGLSLSGGLDSTAIAATASQLVPAKHLLSFSFRYKDMPCDEGDYIGKITHKTGIENIPIQALEIDIKNTYTLENYYREHTDWPARQFQVFFLSLLQLAREKGVQTLLTGWGGDQVCQGSLYYLADLARQGRLVKLFRELGIYNSLNLIRGNEAEAVWRYLFRRYVAKPLLPHWIHAVRHLKASHTATDKHFRLQRERETSPDHFHTFALWDNITLIKGFQGAAWTEGVYCQLAQHSGIEILHPFLDSRVVEFLLQVPENQKILGGNSKIILKEAMKDSLPEEILRRKGKAHFRDFLSYLVSQHNAEAVLSGKSLIHIGVMEEKDMSILQNYFLSDKGTRSSAPIDFIDRCIHLECWYNANFT